MADLCHFTPTGGSEIDLNDGTNTFVRYGVDLGAKRTQFDEVRSYTGAIRMLDVHQPMVEMTIPMKVVGTGGTPADDLYDRVAAIKAACVTGGTLEWNADGETAQSFTIGPSPEPEVALDAVYRLRHTALFELHLKRLP